MICVKNSELCRIEANGVNKRRERERPLRVGIGITTNVGGYLEKA